MYIFSKKKWPLNIGHTLLFLPLDFVINDLFFFLSSHISKALHLSIDNHNTKYINTTADTKIKQHQDTK